MVTPFLPTNLKASMALIYIVSHDRISNMEYTISSALAGSTLMSMALAMPKDMPIW